MANNTLKNFWRFLSENKNQFNIIPGFIFLANGFLRLLIVIRAAPEDTDLISLTPFLASLSFVVGWFIALMYEKTQSKQLRWLPIIIFIVFGILVFTSDMKVTEVFFMAINMLVSGYFFRLSMIVGQRQRQQMRENNQATDGS